MRQSLIISTDFIKDITDILNKNNYSRVLFITGKTFHSYIDESKFFHNYKIKIFSNFDKNTNIEDTLVLSKIINDYNPDIIIALGGGSVIDIAKQANVLSNHHDIELVGKLINTNVLDVINKHSPLIAIPTTAGTGSEATQFSVIYINQIKFSIDDKKLMPDYIILDNNLLKNMPKRLIATTAMDALTQSIESIWSIKSTDESIGYATQAVSLIKENIFDAYNGGYDNSEIASNMQLAAYLSGKAINISRTTAAHALSYPITIHHEIPHGHAVAISIIRFFKINANTSKYEINDPRGKEHIDKIMRYIFSLFDCTTHQECSSYFKNLMSSISLEYNYQRIGIKSERDIDQIISEINHNRLNNNPVRLSDKEIKDIFHE